MKRSNIDLMRWWMYTFLTLFGYNLCAQQIGTEQLATKTFYKGDFKVEGDKDTYYPVIFKYGNQNLVNHLKIYRSYHEAGPVELHATHKGALLLEIDVNYGGWGGQTYNWKIAAHQEEYHPTFADADYAMHYMGFVVWLRGGGFLYHYESEKPATLQIAYSTSEIIYQHPNTPSFDRYAPASLTAVNTAKINSRKIAMRSDIPVQWQNNGSNIHFSTGAVAIGTNNPKSYKLAVAGTAAAEKIRVLKQTAWADDVFEPEYPLSSLKDVDSFIRQNKHLPGIPKAVEVAEHGYDIGSMDAALLRKIEELTLHAIRQEKRNEELAEQIQKLQQKLEDLEQSSHKK